MNSIIKKYNEVNNNQFKNRALNIKTKSMKISQYISVSLLLFIMNNAFAQKAFDAVYYTGKTQNISVQFMLANGYIGGSEIKTTDLKTKKTSKFLPNFDEEGNSDRMKFYHYSTSKTKFTDYFILNGIKDGYDENPSTIKGTYNFDGHAYDIILKVKK